MRRPCERGTNGRVTAGVILRAATVLALGAGACGTPAQTVTPDGAVVSDGAATDPQSDALVATLAGRRVLWVGAHPDDESVVTPLLAEVCLDRGARCSLLVGTRGESGDCARVDGCAPDLATVRAGEMREAARLLGATLVMWDLRDGAGADPDTVAAAWASQRGSPAALVASMQAAIEAASPDVVLTFDPRHGTTCHPDHRAMGALVVAAVRAMARPPALMFSEARFDLAPDGTRIGYLAVAADDPALRRYDATRLLRARDGTAWDALVATVRAHASQFPPARVAAFLAAPASERVVPLLPLDAATADDARYTICR